MRLIKPKVEILDILDERAAIHRIATVARTCYKSEDYSTVQKDKALVKRLIDSKHDAMLEFVDVTVRFTTDRAIANELVRHRMASYAQESTRYCNYSKDKFGNELTFIMPSWLDWQITDEDFITEATLSTEDIKNTDIYSNYISRTFLESLLQVESAYLSLVRNGWTAEQARAVLPLCTKTEINMKANLREWRHFFRLRCSKHAHPDMRVLALDLLKRMHDKLPTIFEDIYQEFYGTERQDD